MQDGEQPAAGGVERRGGGRGQRADGGRPPAAGGAVQPATHLSSTAEPGGEGEIHTYTQILLCGYAVVGN